MTKGGLWPQPTNRLMASRRRLRARSSARTSWLRLAVKRHARTVSVQCHNKNGKLMNRQWLSFATVLFAVGCNTLQDKKIESQWVKGAKGEVATGTPVRMVVTWTNGTFAQPGYRATRGFAGRVHFYDKDYHAVKVDGQLRIYGFDDSHKRSSRTSADKQFVFTSDHLKWRMSESQLGPSYNIWIPWDGVNGQQKDITLVPVFQSASGSLVRGDQSLNVLAGKKNPQFSKRDNAGSRAGHVQLASHATSAGTSEVNSLGTPYAPDNTGLRTTTINVPVGTKRHLQAPLRRQPAIDSRSQNTRQTPSSMAAQKAQFDQLQNDWKRLRESSSADSRPQTTWQAGMPTADNTDARARALEAATSRRPDLRQIQGTRQLPPSTRYSPHIRPVQALPGVRPVGGHGLTRQSPSTSRFDP